MRKLKLLVVAFGISLATFFQPIAAFALITGGEGNGPVHDPGWPDGALQVANLKTRIAWWEGPPYGGGQWHFEYRGTNEDLQQAINSFAKIDAKNLELFVHAGAKESNWIRIGQQKSQQMDWEFVVWVEQNWQQLKQLGNRFLPPDADAAAPPIRLNVYLADRIDWTKLVIPKGVKIVDRRLESNGIPADQGGAIRGRVTTNNGAPIAGAKVRLGDGSPGEVTTEADGSFLITRIPEGTHALTVEAEGFATRDAGHCRITKTTYHETEVRLVPSCRVVVRVVDPEGNALEGVGIRISSSLDDDGGHYPMGGKKSFVTDASGQFVIPAAPQGRLKFGSRTREYYYNPVLNEHHTSAIPIVLKMSHTGSIHVAVSDQKGEPVRSRYIVQVAPESGGGVGTWGGSASIREDGTVSFENMPPGRYIVTGRPNPGNARQTTDGITVEIKGKDEHVIEMQAK